MLRLNSSPLTSHTLASPWRYKMSISSPAVEMLSTALLVPGRTKRILGGKSSTSASGELADTNATVVPPPGTGAMWAMGEAKSENSASGCQSLLGRGSACACCSSGQDKREVPCARGAVRGPSDEDWTTAERG